MTITQLAKDVAEAAHKGQVRKYTGEPYIVHPCEVADIVRSVGGDDGMIAAAYLHDVVEDTNTTLDDIRDAFGNDIASLVEMLTDVSKKEDGNRKKRKEIDRLHTAAASARAKTVKLADLISNTASIAAHDKEFAKVYLAEKRLLLDVLKDGDETLYAEALRLVELHTSTGV